MVEWLTLAAVLAVLVLAFVDLNARRELQLRLDQVEFGLRSLVEDRAEDRPVRWRGTALSPRGEAVRLSFEATGGLVLRFRLEPTDARYLSETIAEMLEARQARLKVQSERSSGSPISDGSKPSDGQKVLPETRSSSAASGDR